MKARELLRILQGLSTEKQEYDVGILQEGLDADVRAVFTVEHPKQCALLLANFDPGRIKPEGTVVKLLYDAEAPGQAQAAGEIRRPAGDITTKRLQRPNGKSDDPPYTPFSL